MTVVDYLFGFPDQNIEVVRGLLEHVLDFHMNPRESLYHGGDYYKYSDGGDETFILQMNFDALDETFAEPDFPDMGVLLYIYATKRSEVLEQSMAEKVREARLLRKEYDNIDVDLQ